MPVRIEIVGLELKVRFTGADRIWSMSRGVTMPLAAVTAARAVRRADAVRDLPPLRMPGVYMPRMVLAGSYRGPHRRPELWCVRRGEELLAISLIGQPYTRLVLEVPEPAAAARAIEVARTNAA